jgi:predicted transcriptional regulator
VGRTTKHQQALYLEHERAKQLDQLAQQTRIPKSVLLREAVDDLLIKHKVLRTANIRRPGTRT